jgi:hypothetical protein
VQLVRCALKAAEKGGEDFDAVPEILQAKVFVSGVLIVVVVRDGEGDDGNVVASQINGTCGSTSLRG